LILGGNSIISVRLHNGLNLTDRMGNLPPFRKIACKWRLSLLIFLFLIFFLTLTLCTSPTKNVVPSRDFLITKEERAWLLEFFRDLLFDNDGAYTLFGTKPVSAFLIEEPSTEQELAEWKAYYESLSEEEKSKLGLRTKRYDFAANFLKWQEIKNRFPIRQYLFGTFRLDDKTELVFFVNIEMAIRTLLKYYEDFRRVTGFEFDPFQVVFEVENRESPFWNKVVLHGHALAGIILGYGRDNGWFFEWEIKYRKEQNQMGSFVSSLPSKFYEETDIKYPDPQNFPLPIFKSFGLYSNDQQLVDQYKIEQKKIKALYKGQDEVDVALEWLTR
jgi:hypothetical protein